MCSAHSGYLTGQNILIDGGSFNSTLTWPLGPCRIDPLATGPPGSTSGSMFVISRIRPCFTARAILPCFNFSAVAPNLPPPACQRPNRSAVITRQKFKITADAIKRGAIFCSSVTCLRSTRNSSMIAAGGFFTCACEAALANRCRALRQCYAIFLK